MDLDQEFATRNFIFPVDESQHQTDLIQRENFTETERIINKITGKVEYDYKYQQLKKALTLLELYTVLIPTKMHSYAYSPPPKSAPGETVKN